MADKKFSGYSNVPIPADGDILLYENASATNSLNQTYAQHKTDISIQNITVSAKTEGVGSPYTILSTDINTTFTNTGASAEVYLDLPEATVGLRYLGNCTDSDLIRFTANGTNIIRDDVTISIAGGFLQLGAIGSTVELVCVESGIWIVASASGSIILETS